MAIGLNVASAAAAFLAAVFWFLSAARPLPRPTTYWDHTPDTDPFLQALRAAVRHNRYAALCAGVAALSQAAAAALQGH
jgi:hypothetical protein